MSAPNGSSVHELDEASAGELLEKARRRFALDAVFHAQVVRIVQVVALDCRQTAGSSARLTMSEDGAATVAAAVALQLIEDAGRG